MSTEKYKIYIRAVIGALLLGALLTWLHDVMSGEEGRVRKSILRCKKAVESRDILACADMISRSYHDKYGNDRESLIYGAKEFFDYYKKVFITVESMKIELDDSKTQAGVEMVALVIGQDQQDSEEKILEGEKERFHITVVKEKGKWCLSQLEFFEPMTLMGQQVA